MTTISLANTDNQPSKLEKEIQSINLNGSVGVVIYKKGLVYVKRANSTYWQQVTLYTKFQPLDTIQTDNRAICEIKLYGNHVLRLEPSSNFSFAEKNPGLDKWASFKINTGKIWVKIIKDAPNAKNFTLDTPHASISVKGTVFSVEAPHGKITTYEGIVQVTQQNLTITVNAGEQTRINKYGFMTNAEEMDEEGISSFEEFEQKSTYFQATTIKAISISTVTPIKNKNLLKKSQKLKAKEVRPLTQNVIVSTNLKQPNNNQIIIETKPESPIELLISKNNSLSILNDSLLYRNPAILSQISDRKINSVYYNTGTDGSVQKYDNNYTNSAYITDPSIVNAGQNHRIEDNQVLGIRTLEKGTGLGVYFKKQRYLHMVSASTANLYQNNILHFFYGKSFEIRNNTDVAFLIRTAVLTGTEESKTTFSGDFNSIFGVGSERTDLSYALDIGLLHKLHRQFSIGLSYKGIINDPLDTQLENEDLLYFTGIYLSDYQTTEISYKTHKNNSSVLFNSTFKVPNYEYLLFTAKAEFAAANATYAFMVDSEMSSTFRLFFQYSFEQVKDYANDSVVSIGGQLDF